MKWNELIKIAVSKGYRLYAHGKKHDIYIHETTGERLVVKRHSSQEIRKGLMMALKKQIGF